MGNIGAADSLRGMSPEVRTFSSVAMMACLSSRGEGWREGEKEEEKGWTLTRRAQRTGEIWESKNEGEGAEVRWKQQKGMRFLKQVALLLGPHGGLP